MINVEIGAGVSADLVATIFTLLTIEVDLATIVVDLATIVVDLATIVVDLATIALA